jgi:hypothetical protein
MTALARASINFKQQTRPSVRKGDQYQQSRSYVTRTKIFELSSVSQSVDDLQSREIVKYGQESRGT